MRRSPKRKACLGEFKNEQERTQETEGILLGRFFLCSLRYLLLKLRAMLPDEQPSPEQIEIFRRMTPGRRLQLAEQLYWSARRLKTAGVRAHHPDWPEEQVDAEVRRIFLYART
jgi:hypothetical protein